MTPPTPPRPPAGRGGPSPDREQAPPSDAGPLPGRHWRAGAGLVWLPTAREMAELDRRATESGATTERTLIEAAGREVARQVAARWPAGPVVGLLGSGHNGADCMVALRTLRAWGRKVRGVVCGSGPPEPDVTAGWEIPLEDRSGVREAARGAAVVLDGILGTGVEGAPREPQAEVIRAVNGLGVPVAAVDGPSGADFTTGAVPGECVRAALTVCLGWPNLGLLLHPARQRCGEFVAVEIGFPPPPDGFGARAVTGRWVRDMLRRRPPDAHKGEAGYLSVVAGQRGMAGASVLAARAAGRGGAGIVRVVGDPANRTVVQAAVPDAVFTPWEDPDAVAEAVEWAHALVVGPGLGRGEGRRELVAAVLEARGDRPVLLDADGLNVWEGRAEELAGRLRAGDLLTPHPGELGRLLGRSTREVVEDPPARAREVADRFGATVLLKGAPSLVAPADGGPLRVATAAGPEVASGGSGDVLAGLAGAHLAAGAPAPDAAAAALFLSGLAASRSPVAEGHLASDVPDRLPEARARVEALGPAGSGPVLFALPASPGAPPPPGS